MAENKLDNTKLETAVAEFVKDRQREKYGSLFPYIILVILEVLVLPVCLSVRKINQQLAMEQDRM